MTKTFKVKMSFTDENGIHSAGTSVILPADTDTDHISILTLLNYGVITESKS